MPFSTCFQTFSDDDNLAINKHYYEFLTLTFLTLVNSLYDYNLDSFTKIQSHTLLEMSLFAAELSHI